MINVAVEAPLSPNILAYLPGDATFLRGQIVAVPLGRREVLGVVVGEGESSLPIEKLKAIKSVVTEFPLLKEKDLQLFEWMSRYYHYPLGMLALESLPKAMKRPRAIEFIKGEGEPLDHQLNSKQQNVYDQVSQTLGKGLSQHLLHGVTGSGKSLVYLKLMLDVLARGESVQFLLPEINLTPQFLEIFQKHLNVPIYSYHSAVTASEKYLIWKELNDHDGPCVIMGVRSSVFLPVQKLGLMIIDEEHDHSFKQEDRCPYNAREVAIKKAQLHQCPILLGSATPTVENYFHFKKGDQGRHYYQMADRVGKSVLPKLELIDLRAKDDLALNNHWPFHPKTLEAIHLALEAKEQVLVFINKLGFSQYLQCRACGYVFINENCGCNLSLRYFKSKNVLSCSHCEFKMRPPEVCPKCSCMTLTPKGFGTERVHEILHQSFPQFRVERFDRDEITTHKELVDKLDRFHRHEIDLFVGTQMLAKGHNFKKVNLVVILGFDHQLNFADFRSEENAYQLARQVSGRAGRYSDTGKVLIQTYNPEAEIFKFIQSDDLDEFYQHEISLRELCQCPPFRFLATLYFSSSDRERLVQTIEQVGNKLKSTLQHFPHTQVLGPVPSMIEKRAEQFTWCLVIKSSERSELHGLLQTFEKNYQAVSKISIKVDVDPVHSF